MQKKFELKQVIIVENEHNPIKTNNEEKIVGILDERIRTCKKDTDMKPNQKVIVIIDRIKVSKLKNGKLNKEYKNMRKYCERNGLMLEDLYERKRHAAVTKKVAILIRADAYLTIGM